MNSTLSFCHHADNAHAWIIEFCRNKCECGTLHLSFVYFKCIIKWQNKDSSLYTIQEYLYRSFHRISIGFIVIFLNFIYSTTFTVVLFVSYTSEQ